MRHRSWRRAASAVGVTAFVWGSQVLPVAAQSTGGGASRFTATAIAPESREEAVKSVSGRLAQSDPTLLTRTDSAPVNIMVKLDFDATASYQGDVAGLAATSPQVTGQKLSGSSASEQAYDAYTTSLLDKAAADIVAKVPSAKIGRSLQTVYGGLSVQVPANTAASLLQVENVAAVQLDKLEKPLTDSSTQFIGAPTLWNQEGGQALGGRGVIFADLDTGIWPEHPSFADNPALGNPPPTTSGDPRSCNFGDNPLTPALDVFRCNHKLIGGQAFLATYNSAFGDEVYPDTARDSNGHGTHTTSTAAGDRVASAPVFGIERGPLSGVAPGAWVIEYKVCGFQGCFGSDSAAAVAHAILDGADVINFSISGGTSPYTDPVELAFLDAYNAGVFVAASAGNSGPAAGTTSHQAPWVTTVAASTQTRTFQSTITLTAGTTTATFTGASITHGISTATPVIVAKDIAGYNKNCIGVPSPAAVSGKIVGCERGGDALGRVQKGYNLSQAGAAGMILYNPTLADTETDNHFLPAVHLGDGTDFVAFMDAHPGVTGTLTDGTKTNGQGDVMASFSSRGPGGQFLKPDITAPGVQILAGNTPIPGPQDIPSGPAGQYFQAIAGTSMSSPHIAGSALLVASLHRDWSPGAIKSALMTTANTNVVKENLTSPADPFDDGAGRVDLNKAGSASLVIEDTVANFRNLVNLGVDPVTAIQLNVPSINVPIMPGVVTVRRTVRNVTKRPVIYSISGRVPPGSTISVLPPFGVVKPGQSQAFYVTIRSSAPSGQYFGQVNIFPSSGPALHLPVAFFNQQGAVTLESTCADAAIRRGQTTKCTIAVNNDNYADADVQTVTSVSRGLKLVSANGAAVRHGVAQAGPLTLPARKDGAPSIASIPAGDTPGGGYLPLELFGVAPVGVGDETIVNFGVPTFTFAGRAFNRIGVTSNGYLVAGGGTATDVTFIPQTFPNPARPNGVLAPYWTDLDGSGTPGVRVGELTDGVNNWIVVQWNVHAFGQPTELRSFQTWIGVNGTTGPNGTPGPEDITYSYQPNALVGVDPIAVGPLRTGAENFSGTAGDQISTTAPTGSYVVTSTPGAPGGSLTYSVTIKGIVTGSRAVTTAMTASLVPGVTVKSTPIEVTR